MKIAIYHSTAEYSFSGRWIDYCEKKHIDYKIVNPYDTDIIQQVADCDAFMWHHYQANYKDALFAKQLLYSLEMSGKTVFPDWRTGWHFDDKVGQKYLLESINAPLVPSYVFYTKKEALEWIKHTTFPKVFKLRGGAGSSNVKLAHSKREAKHFVQKAFGKGFPQYDKWAVLKERFKKWRKGKDSLKGVCIAIARLIVPPTFARMHAAEKGYVYFQDYIPNNDYDTRIVVIGGEKALCERRYCREGDFRASGSGKFEYVKAEESVLNIAFNVAQHLNLQTVAFDFINNEDKPLIVEISYGFGSKGITHCPGYYTSDLKWHDETEPFFCGWMVDNLIKQCQKS